MLYSLSFTICLLFVSYSITSFFTFLCLSRHGQITEEELSTVLSTHNYDGPCATVRFLHGSP